MTMLLLVGAVVLGVSGWIGSARTAARSLTPFFVAVSGLLVTALICWAIGEGKSGQGFLSGIVGIMMSMAMLVLAAGLVLGALGRRLYERLNGAPVVRPAPLSPAWDMIGLGVLAVAALALSIFE